MDVLLGAWPLALMFRFGEVSWDQMSGLIERQLALDALELRILQAITGSSSKINALINLNNEKNLGFTERSVLCGDQKPLKQESVGPLRQGTPSPL